MATIQEGDKPKLTRVAGKGAALVEEAHVALVDGAKGLELETTAWRYKNATGQQEVWITRREEGLTVV
ncbi:MAG: hypothetical protein ACO3X1_14890 [Burkholderiaceae bacterium]